MPHALVLWLLAWSLAAGTALAEPVAPVDRNLFAFGGRMTAEAMPKSVNIPGVSYEDNGILGIGIQRWTWRGRHVDIGYEGGLAHRFGRDTTTEAWAGIGIRCCRYRLMRDLVLTPSIIFGLSYVDAGIWAGKPNKLRAMTATRNCCSIFHPNWSLPPPTRTGPSSGGFITVRAGDRRWGICAAPPTPMSWASGCDSSCGRAVPNRR